MREEEVRYVNRVVTEFVVDLDKLCDWDLLGDVKKLGYDIKKDARLSYKDDNEILRSIYNDQTI